MRSQEVAVSPSGSARAEPRWVYLSTTGVFAPTGSVNHGAEWVDESSAVGPVRPGSIAALGGEDWINKSLSEEDRVILRPAGIYGPDRVPRWQAIRDQKPLEVDPASYLNLIHVSDGKSPTRQEYYEWISQWMGLPLPVFAEGGELPSRELPTETTTGEPMIGMQDRVSKKNRPVSRSDSNKRVSNRKLVAELNLQFQYPTFRQGLQSLMHHPQ
jgi:nucleoside-diphosphate-sugar epimerase